jgi:cell division protein FtsB
VSDVRPETGGRTNRAVVGVATLLAVVLLVLGGLKGYRDLAAAQAREAVLEERIEEVQQGIEALDRRIERLKGDPVTLERLAREELGWAQPNELIIVLPGSTGEGSVSVAASNPLPAPGDGPAPESSP